MWLLLSGRIRPEGFGEQCLIVFVAHDDDDDDDDDDDEIQSGRTEKEGLPALPIYFYKLVPEEVFI